MKQLTAEQLSLLKKPLPAEAIKPHPTKTYLSSIKAIYVVERLNDVFGLGGWEIENTVVKEEGKWVVVKSTFIAKEYNITVRDIFGGNDNQDLGDAYKGACTDALTKIGSYLGIGMDVYKGLTEQPKAATSYNHKAIEQNGKPLLTNANFKKVMERIEKGEKDVYYKTIDAFSLDATQKQLLEKTYKAIKNGTIA